MPAVSPVSCIHHLPGRIRAHVPSLKANPRAAERLARVLHAQAGVEQVEVSSVTGSVLIAYDATVSTGSRILALFGSYSKQRPSGIGAGGTIAVDRAANAFF